MPLWCIYLLLSNWTTFKHCEILFFVCFYTNSTSCMLYLIIALLYWWYSCLPLWVDMAMGRATQGQDYRGYQHGTSGGGVGKEGWYLIPGRVIEDMFPSFLPGAKWGWRVITRQAPLSPQRRKDAVRNEFSTAKTEIRTILGLAG